MIAQRWTLGILTVLGLTILDSFGAGELQRPDPGKRIQVFLFAGQSNMEGRADGEKISDADRKRLRKAQNRVQLSFNHEPIRPLDVVEPSDEIRRAYQRDLIFGPELFFGVALSEARPTERFLFIKLSAGGSSLHGCWNPDWSEDKAAVMGEEDDPRLYQDLVNYIHDTLSKYLKNEYEIRAMLWVQGETDSGVEIAAQEYGNNLRNLIKRIRKDLNEPKLPFILFQVGHGRVVEGMIRSAREVPNTILVPRSEDPGSEDFYPTMKNGHLDYEGMKKLGTRFAEVFLNKFD